MGDRLQTMRAAWLAVADACESVDDDAWEDCAATVLAVMDDAIDAPSKVGFTWADTAAAIRAMCGPDEDAPPAADVSLLALANRALIADLEAARAEISEAMAILDAGAESLGDGTPVPTTLVQRARNVAMALSAEAEEANRLQSERDTLLQIVSERTAERDEARTITDRNINFRAKLWEALGGHVASDPLEPLSEGAARVRRERDEARAEVERLGGALDAIRSDWRIVVAERDNARRILAVERGDQTQAPTGWGRHGDAMWQHRDGALIQRAHDEPLDSWIRRRVMSWDPRNKRWTSALEAMEAIDAERARIQAQADADLRGGSADTWADTAAAIRAMVGPDEDAPPPADVSLLALANRTLTADLEAARAEVARLTRILAVERGDQAQAPAGWAWVDGAWVGPGLVRLVRRDSGEWAWWDGRAVRTWPSALEAMEAIDGERGGVSNG